ncbi:MAG: BUG/TctC family periplasmic protein, partial [uncultured Acetobacteraceae bacterium]
DDHPQANAAGRARAARRAAPSSPRAGLSGAARHLGRALRCRRHHRHHSAADRAEDGRAARPAGGGGEPAGRRWHHRHGAGLARAAGRLHAALRHAEHPRGGAAALPQPALRPGAGLRAGLGAGRGGEPAGLQPRPSDPQRGRAGRAREGAAGRHQLRLHRRRHRAAHGGRAVPAGGGRAADPRALCRLPAGAERPGHRPHGHHVRLRPDRAAARPRRAAPRLGGDGDGALGGRARGADHRGSGAAGRRNDGLGRRLCPRAHAGAGCGAVGGGHVGGDARPGGGRDVRPHRHHPLGGEERRGHAPGIGGGDPARAGVDLPFRQQARL